MVSISIRGAAFAPRKSRGLLTIHPLAEFAVCPGHEQKQDDRAEGKEDYIDNVDHVDVSRKARCESLFCCGRRWDMRVGALDKVEVACELACDTCG
jgi:hypothetical protein